MSKTNRSSRATPTALAALLSVALPAAALSLDVTAIRNMPRSVPASSSEHTGWMHRLSEAARGLCAPAPAAVRATPCDIARLESSKPINHALHVQMRTPRHDLIDLPPPIC